jgi:hypothetical protein
LYLFAGLSNQPLDKVDIMALHKLAPICPLKPRKVTIFSNFTTRLLHSRVSIWR